jgi:DinB superfamily
VRAVTVTPDDKNWTWVIEQTCPECGFDGPAYDARTAAARIRALGDEWATILTRPDARPWSPLEYGCHVRDVFRVYDGRLHRMLTEDGPHYANWDQDATAVEERYAEQDPAQVAVELRAAAAQLADRYDTVPDDGWSRTGNRSDGSTFTVDTFSRYLVHDLVHHVHDVTPRS